MSVSGSRPISVALKCRLSFSVTSMTVSFADGHDVIVGQYIALAGIDDDAGPGSLHLAAHQLVRHAEELAEEWILHQRVLHLDAAADRDIDDALHHLVDDGGEGRNVSQGPVCPRQQALSASGCEPTTSMKTANLTARLLLFIVIQLLSHALLSLSQVEQSRRRRGLIAGNRQSRRVLKWSPRKIQYGAPAGCGGLPGAFAFCRRSDGLWRFRADHDYDHALRHHRYDRTGDAGAANHNGSADHDHQSVTGKCGRADHFGPADPKLGATAKTPPRRSRSSYSLRWR